MMTYFEKQLGDLELEFKETLRTLCEIFEDHTLPELPEWIEDAMTIRR